LKTYLYLSNFLVASSIIFFILSFFPNIFPRPSGEGSYGAVGYVGFIPLAFILLTIFGIHAGIAGYFYLKSNSNLFVKYLSIFDALLPVITILIVAIVSWSDTAYSDFKRYGTLDYAVEHDDSAMIRKALEKKDFRSNLYPRTVTESLLNGLSSESIDLLIAASITSGSIFIDSYYSYGDFRVVCLEGLLDANRKEWTHYLELFNSQTEPGKFDVYALRRAVNRGTINTQVIDYFLNQPEKIQTTIDWAISSKSHIILRYIMEKGIHIQHSTISDLLGYAADHSKVFDLNYLKFLMQEVYRYDIPNDNKYKQLLLRIKDPETLRWMIKNGATVFQTDSDGNSFLHKIYLENPNSAYTFRDIYSEYAISNHLDIKNKDGITVHMLMAQFAPYELSIEIDDVDVALFDNNENHLLHYLFKSGHFNNSTSSAEEFLRKILDKYKNLGLDINTRNKSGVHPLQSVLFSGVVRPFSDKFGFHIDIINPVSKEFVLVDAFNDYIADIVNNPELTYHYENGNENLYRNFPDLSSAFKLIDSIEQRKLALENLLGFYALKSQIIGKPYFIEEVINKIKNAFTNSLNE
jgi:hypothetical protein